MKLTSQSATAPKLDGLPPALHHAVGPVEEQASGLFFLLLLLLPSSRPQVPALAGAAAGAQQSDCFLILRRLYRRESITKKKCSFWCKMHSVHLRVAPGAAAVHGLDPPPQLARFFQVVVDFAAVANGILVAR